MHLYPYFSGKVTDFGGLAMNKRHKLARRYGCEVRRLDLFADVGDYKSGLQDRGFKIIGSGWYGAVLAKPGSDRVLKIGPACDGWLRFAVWAAQNPGPCVPKIYSIRTYKTFYVAVVERLDATLDDVRWHHKEKYDRIRDVATEFAKRKDMGTSCGPVTWARRIMKNPDKYPSQCAELADTILKMKDIVKGTDFGWDLHDNNVMLRGYQLVITDPFFGEEEPEKRPVYRRGTFAYKEAA